jgi:hypothetical protein
MARDDYRIQRGEILRMLYRLYPQEAGDNLIAESFIWITPSVIAGHAAYLVERGYAARRDIDHNKFGFSTANWLLKITPQGINLLEGSIDADPGIKSPPL